MFTLIGLGTGTAYLYSLAATLVPFGQVLELSAAMTFSSVSVISNAL